MLYLSKFEHLIEGIDFRSHRYYESEVGVIMPDVHFFSKTELIKILEDCLGRTLGEVDSKGVFERTIEHPKITGIAGDVIEQSVLGYPADSYQRPDLDIDGESTELKTTGLKESRTAPFYQAKEPMSITAVSPDVIVSEDFSTSNFYHKINHMLIVYYLYESARTVIASEYANFPIKGYDFFEFDEQEMQSLEQDWKIVRDFIIYLQENYTDYKSEYPRISSELRSQLFMIDTAPKYPNPPRFRLKKSVVTTMARQHFGEVLEQLPIKYLRYEDIDEHCKRLTSIYKGYTIGRLVSELEIRGKINGKSIGEQIIVRLFDGHAKKMNKIELFSRVGLIGKTITVTKKGTRTEDIKLLQIDFDELITDDFEESSIREYFANSQMLCILFEEPSVEAPLSENKLLGFKRFVFDENFIENEVKPVILRIKDLVSNKKLVDVTVMDKDGKPRSNRNGTVQSAPNFPKASQGNIFVRGSAIDSNNKNEEVNGIKMYKQFIWIKGAYIVDKLSHIDFL